MHVSQALAAAALAACGAYASPVSDLNGRDLTPAQCSRVAAVVEALKLNQATLFCSSFLSIKPATSTKTITLTKTASKTTTTTITKGTPSISEVFRSGNRPAISARQDSNKVAQRQEKRDSISQLEERETTLTILAYVTAFATSIISSAYDCLHIPTPTSTVSKTRTTTSTATFTVSAMVGTHITLLSRRTYAGSYPKLAPPVVTSTYYPCATPIPTLTLTLPYGLTNYGGVLTGGSTLYGSNTPYDSLEGCCSFCFFGMTNCIQAYWYYYEGRVIVQAQTVIGTGVGVSDVCPNGKIKGLVYSPDSNAPFRSTGDIAGPCGVQYNDL